MTTNLARFRRFVTERLGLAFDEAQITTLADGLERRADAKGVGVTAYVDELERGEDAADAEPRELARLLTVGETYFFRHVEQLHAFSDVVLRDRARAVRTNGKLRILSAGCASGEEPYSLAMLAREAGADGAPWDPSIVAIDVNRDALERAAHMRYSRWALRETPAAAQSRWFRADGRDFVLDPTLRSAVAFTEHNLCTEGDGLFAPNAFDVVFCRNVLMYFAPEKARAVVARFARSLTPGGYLFLGHAENLRGISQEFRLLNTHGAFYYQKLDGGAEAGDRRAPLPATIPLDASWVETIRRAHAKVESLVPDAGTSRPERARAWDLDRPLELLRQERFSDATRELSSLPVEAAGDSDVLLLRAVLLTHGGDLGEAERACRELFARDALSSGAHYLLALCREAAGDRLAAEEHHRLATHLDPSFAMPRLHLGLLASRAGRADDAREDLGLALVLLRREDPSRVLLFGGGFSRDTLVALCSAGLESAGAP